MSPVSSVIFLIILMLVSKDGHRKTLCKEVDNVCLHLSSTGMKVFYESMSYIHYKDLSVYFYKV